MTLAEAEGRRREVSGRDRHRRRHHRPGLLQRRPASGHQGRRQDRRPQRQAYRQRADRCCSGLRPGQAGHRPAASWSSTWAAAPSTSPSSTSPTACLRLLSTSGDNHLGGDDWDQRVIDWMADKFQQENGVDLRQDPMALQRLKEAAENAKKELSAAQQTTINLPFITTEPVRPAAPQLHADPRRVREDHHATCSSAASSLSTNALRDAKLKLSDLTEVILVGGSTRMPAVQELVKTMTGKQPNMSVNPDEVVADGRCRPGRRAHRRRRGHPAARRYPAVAGR